MRSLPTTVLVLSCLPLSAGPYTAGNRLAYLDTLDPYCPSRTFPRLTTPQWVGEEGVYAVIVLSIDDMRDVARYEAFIRPILDRLEEIDGRAPLSIMTNTLDPAHPHLQEWLREGVSLETHTIDHPCPILAGGDFERAKSTYDRCVDLLASVSGSHPVAFRVPCMDSRNTPSPRFYREVFNRTTPSGNFLAIDSSVSNIPTADDLELPSELVFDGSGRERFRKYVPFPSYANTIEDYPYPYVIDRLCWELPCVVPSDWQAQNIQGQNAPETVRDLEMSIDLHVAKQGTFSFIFHPHGWIRNDQVVELIDHAVARHGRRVLFLNFREVLERLEDNLLAGHPLRTPNGQDNGVRLLDLDGDGTMDVVIGNESGLLTRVWSHDAGEWRTTEFPVRLVDEDETGNRRDAGVRFGILDASGAAGFIVRTEARRGGWRFAGGEWIADPTLLEGLEIDGEPVLTARRGIDGGVRLRDLDGDGISEVIVAHPEARAVFRRRAGEGRWEKLPFAPPEGARIVDPLGRDAGLRFADVDEDLRLDLLVSNEERFSLDLFASMESGWSHHVLGGTRQEASRAKTLPPFVRDGADEGAWFHSRHLWVQNEHTDKLPDLVDRRSFAELLEDIDPPARSPEASLAAIEVRQGFRVELMAAEPLVRDPVAFDWSPDGKLWIVEMIDYPLGAGGKGGPGGRVVWLEDADGDGGYDRSTVFLDGLRFPTGVRPWGDGILVTAAPDILYAEDTSGDGRADRRDVLYTGFGEGNQQHRVNTLVWGLDNWLHGANGDSGGVIRSQKTGESADIRGRDFRIRPDEGLIDAVTGQTQFSRTQDDWGNWFGCSNPNPMFHFVLDDSYLRRNPHVAPPEVRVQVAPPAGRVYPRSRMLPRYNDQHMANRFTSACGLTVYRDDLFGPEFEGNAFVSEPVHNLVHRIVLEPDGVTFTSRRAPGEESAEFLASSDNWFRPTSLRAGPDGALWIADMYRRVIEHPQYFFEGNFQKLDVRAGSDRGRIYRVVPGRVKPRSPAPLRALRDDDVELLAAALESPSGWVRDMAHQLLARGRNPLAIPHLIRIIAESPRPAARVHALSALDAVVLLKEHELEPAILARALEDPHPGVRRHAVRLSEPFLDGSPLLREALERLVDDPDPHVRLQLAYSLGASNSARAGRALGRLAVRDAEDPAITHAALSSASKSFDDLLAAVLEESGRDGTKQAAVQSLLERLLPLAALLDRPRALSEAIDAIRTPAGDPPGSYAAWQFEALAGLFRALRERKGRLEGEVQKERPALEELANAARHVAADAAAPTELRLAAVHLLGESRHIRSGEEDVARDAALLSELLVAANPHPIQEAAIDGLARFPGRETPALILHGWSGLSPGLRSRALDAALARDSWLPAILDLLSMEALPRTALDASRRRRLLEHDDTVVRERARDLFGAISKDRAAVVAEFQSVKELEGNASRGLEAFEKRCAACHVLAGTGHAVGPDLAALVDKSADALLVAVLDPNRSIETKYAQYTAVTRDGSVASGIIAEETGTSITILSQEGRRHVILRRDIVRLESNESSMMPEGIEKDLTAEELADLLALLEEHEPPRKEFPGNSPRVVRPRPDGTILLATDSCEIYGSSVRLEGFYGNLGFWSGEDDRAVWRIEAARAGRYEVVLDWAAPDDCAGSRALVESPAGRLEITVESTGSWDQYRQKAIGELELRQGLQRVVFRSHGPIRECLLDIRKLTLRPLVGR